MSDLKKDILANLRCIAPSKHRYKVFSEWVELMAITLHNQGVYMDKTKEQRYLDIINDYEKPDQVLLSETFAKFILLIDTEPKDFLGEIYMSLDYGDKNSGQFFTPNTVSEFMAKITLGDLSRTLQTQDFVTVSEPTIGGGGMVLAIVKDIIKQGYNPCKKIWVQGIDISHIAFLMSYVQLSLWNVPAEIIHGNALSLERWAVWYTPAHKLFRWDAKLKKRAEEEVKRNNEKKVVLKQDELEVESSDNVVVLPTINETLSSEKKTIEAKQFSFDF